MERQPLLRVQKAVLHRDEATPHGLGRDDRHPKPLLTLALDMKCLSTSNSLAYLAWEVFLRLL